MLLSIREKLARLMDHAMSGLEQHLVQIPFTGNKANRIMSYLIKQENNKTRVCLRWINSTEKGTGCNVCLCSMHSCIYNGMQQFWQSKQLPKWKHVCFYFPFQIDWYRGTVCKKNLCTHGRMSVRQIQNLYPVRLCTVRWWNFTQ